MWKFHEVKVIDKISNNFQFKVIYSGFRQNATLPSITPRIRKKDQVKAFSIEFYSTMTTTKTLCTEMMKKPSSTLRYAWSTARCGPFNKKKSAYAMFF